MNNQRFTVNINSVKNEGLDWKFEISGYDPVMGQHYSGTASKGFDGILRSDLLDQRKASAVSSECASYIRLHLTRYMNENRT